MSGASSESMDIEDGEVDALNEIASDMLKLFRLNIFVVAVYTSVVALTVQSGQGVGDVLNSEYTYLAVVGWFGATIFVVYAYFNARMKAASAQSDDYSPHFLHSTGVIMISGFAGVIGTLIAVYGFVFGYLDGLTPGALPIFQPLTLIGAGAFGIFIMTTWVVGGIIMAGVFYLRMQEIRNHLLETSSEFKETTLSQFRDLRSNTDADPKED